MITLRVTFLYVANGTETMAVEQTDGTYKLYGYKWFSSATDADVTFTLARVVDKHGKVIQVYITSFDEDLIIYIKRTGIDCPRFLIVDPL